MVLLFMFVKDQEFLGWMHNFQSESARPAIPLNLIALSGNSSICTLIRSTVSARSASVGLAEPLTTLWSWFA
jgi:hypothetical protein